MTVQTGLRYCRCLQYLNQKNARDVCWQRTPKAKISFQVQNASKCERG